MGILPLQLPPETTASSLNLDGTETFDLRGLTETAAPGVTATLHIHRPNHATTTIALKSRVDTSVEANWLRHGGILPNALCTLIAEAAPAT